MKETTKRTTEEITREIIEYFKNKDLQKLFDELEEA